MNTGVPFTDAFNRLEITSGVWRIMQDAKERAVLDRIADEILQAGVVMPANSTAVDIQNGVPTQFALTNPGGGNITVGPGIAYNALGQRIEIPFGDVTSFNANAPTFTSTISGVGPIQGTTPYSTGNTNVTPLNPNTLTTRFIFIQYVQVVHTKALPPNHNTPTGTVVTIAGGDPDTKKPLTELDEKEGLIYAPHRIDGYKIITAELADLTVGSQPSGTPVLNADTSAIYIGRYDLVGGPPANNITNISMSDALRPRKIFLMRPEDGSKVDSTNKTPVYADQQVVSTQEHVAALGTGTIAPNNPHGLSINDITGGGLEPLNEIYQRDSSESGIIDGSILRTSPIPSGAALNPIISNAPIAATSFIASVQLNQLDASVGQSLYIADARSPKHALRYTSMTPTFASVPGKVVIGFSVADPTGTYDVFAADQTPAVPISVPVAIAQKQLTGALPAGSILLVRVFWTGTVLRKISTFDSTNIAITADAQEVTPLPVDKRNFGNISAHEIDTEAVSHPANGMLADQTFRNLASNPNFFITDADLIGGSANNPFNWSTALPTGAAFVQLRVDNGTVPDLLSGDPGPKEVSAVKLTFSPTGNSLYAKLKGKIGNLKPNTPYTLAVWARINQAGGPLGTPSNTTITTFGRLTDGSGATALSPMKPFTLDPSVAVWQRVMIPLKTNGTPSPIVDANVEFGFLNQGITTPAFTNADIYLTGVVLMEGEWTLGTPRVIPQMYRFTLAGAGTNSPSQITILTENIKSSGQYARITAKCHLNNGFVFNTTSNSEERDAGFFIFDGVTLLDRVYNKMSGYQSPASFPTMDMPTSVSWHGWLTAGLHVITVQISAFAFGGAPSITQANDVVLEVELL